MLGAVAAGGTVAATKLLDEQRTEGNGSVRYSGPFAGQGTRAVGVCIQTQAHSGTAAMELQIASSGMVTGTADVQATITVVSVGPGCSGTTAAQLNEVTTHGCCVPPPPVNGTTSNLTFNGSHPGLGGTTWTYNFSGTVSDSEINGTFTLTISGGAEVTTPPFSVRLTKTVP